MAKAELHQTVSAGKKKFPHILQITLIRIRLSNLTFGSPKCIEVVLQTCAPALLGRTSLQNRNAREL